MKSLPLGLMACAIILLGLYITLAGTNASHQQGVSPRQNNSFVALPLEGASTVSRRALPAGLAESSSIVQTRLEPGLPAKVQLKLVDTEDRPIEGASVRFEQSESRSLLFLGERRSNTNGEVTCTLPSGHPLSVALGGRVWALQQLETESLLPGEVRDLGVHSLIEGGSIHVSVLDESGTPLPRAQLGLLRVGAAPISILLHTVAKLRTPWDRTQTALCNSSGRHRFSGLAPGYYVVVARSGISSTSETREIVEVVAGADAALNLHLDDSVATQGLSGRVVDATGTPVEHALVSAVRTSGLSDTWTWTDALGRFQLSPTPSATELRASARSGTGSVGLVGLESSEVEIRLSPGAELTVRARNEAGEPLRHARIELARWSVAGLDNVRHLQAWTDARGVAVWRSIEEGKWRVRVNAPYYLPGTRELQWDGQADRSIAMQLLPAGCLRIRLLDPTGEVLPHVPLRLRAERGEQPSAPKSATDRAGWAAWNQLADGTYAVLFDDHRPKVARVDNGSPLGIFEIAAGRLHDTEIHVNSMATVRVRVLRGQEPVQDAQVGLCRSGELADLAWQQFTQKCTRATDAEGYVTLLVSAAGAYTLFVSSALGTPSQLVSLQLRHGSQEVEVRICGGDVSGRVAAPGQDAIASAVVQLRPTEEVPGLSPFATTLEDEAGGRSQVRFYPGGGRALTNARGAFSIVDVPAGVYDVEISAEGFLSAVFGSVTLGDGPLDFGLVELVPVRDLHVEVRRLEVQQTSGDELVRARLYSDRTDQVITTKSGSFSFASVVAGPHQLDVRCGERRFSETVVVSPTDTNRIVIELTP